MRGFKSLLPRQKESLVSQWIQGFFAVFSGGLTLQNTLYRFLPFGKTVIVALHSCRRVFHHLFRCMGIDIEREAGGGVAQQVLNAFHVRTAGNGYSRRGVTEVVGPCVRPADAGGNLLEILV